MNNLNSYFRYIFIIYCFCCFYACQTEQRNKSDVLHISNPSHLLSYMQLSDTLILDESQFKIGNIFNNHNIVNSSGEIFILDRHNNCFIRFSNSGKFLGFVGKKGRGPGEYLSPFSLSFDLQNNIYIADKSKQSTIVYDSTGRFLYEVTHIDGLFNCGELQFVNNLRILCMYQPQSKNFYKNMNLFHFLDKDLNIERSLTIDYPELHHQFDLKAFLNPDWVVCNEHIFVNFKGLPEVYQYKHTGELVRVIDLNVSDFQIIDKKAPADIDIIALIRFYGYYHNSYELYLFKDKYLLYLFYKDEFPNDVEIQPFKSSLYRKYFYAICDTSGAIIKLQKNILPGKPLYCTKNGMLYILLSDEPENRKIGVYEIVLEEI